MRISKPGTGHPLLPSAPPGEREGEGNESTEQALDSCPLRLLEKGKGEGGGGRSFCGEPEVPLYRVVEGSGSKQWGNERRGKESRGERRVQRGEAQVVTPEALQVDVILLVMTERGWGQGSRRKATPCPVTGMLDLRFVSHRLAKEALEMVEGQGP